VSDHPATIRQRVEDDPVINDHLCIWPDCIWSNGLWVITDDTGAVIGAACTQHAGIPVEHWPSRRSEH
jgi:hypothetical protein